MDSKLTASNKGSKQLMKFAGSVQAFKNVDDVTYQQGTRKEWNWTHGTFSIQITNNKMIQLRRANSIKLPDAVIAASAIINDSVLLTNDKVFNGIDGLKYRSLRLLDDE